MAIRDVDPAPSPEGPPSPAAEAAAGTPSEPPPADVPLPPSAREARARHAARVRQAVVARWLRRLNDPRP